MSDSTEIPAHVVFSAIYARGGWGSSESVSGRGSEIGSTEVFRNEFSAWLAKQDDIKSILDAPCGDFNWIRLMPEIESRIYIGGDIVPDLIARNASIFSRPGREFHVIDIIDGPLPEADLWLCRDVLFHFPLDVAVRVTNRFRDTSIKYFLATTFPGRLNERSASMGGYAPYNLEVPPFNLPPPIVRFSDPGANPNSGRKIGVWLNECDR